MTLSSACVIDGCESVVKARGWCETHYARWYRTGTVDSTIPTTVERFWSYVEKSDGCWFWTGTFSRKGYGVFSIGPRGACAQLRAHRFSWEMANGRAVPSGLLVRHACDMPACVRPEHLLLGSIADNNRDRFERGGYARKVAV